jgi:hypothetical protein
MVVSDLGDIVDRMLGIVLNNHHAGFRGGYDDDQIFARHGSRIA